MSDVVLVAIVGAAGSVLGSLMGVLSSNKMTLYRIERLEAAVNKHNNLIDRTYKLEQGLSVLKQHVDDLHKNDE